MQWPKHKQQSGRPAVSSLLRKHSFSCCLSVGHIWTFVLFYQSHWTWHAEPSFSALGLEHCLMSLLKWFSVYFKWNCSPSSGLLVFHYPSGLSSTDSPGASAWESGGQLRTERIALKRFFSVSTCYSSHFLSIKTNIYTRGHLRSSFREQQKGIHKTMQDRQQVLWRS